MSFVNDYLLPALQDITNPRFYVSERGYQGELVALLRDRVIHQGVFPEHTIVEEEYQKTLKHHYIKQRPDIIIHIPLEVGLTENRVENNFFVIANKLKATKSEALRDFDSLDEMFAQLEYLEGVFINISGHPNLFLHEYIGNYPERIHEISIASTGNQLSIRHAYLANGIVIEEDIEKNVSHNSGVQKKFCR